MTVGPKPVRLLNLLALGHYNIATIHLENRQYDKALESLKKSLKYRSALVDSHPSVTVFQGEARARLTRRSPMSSTEPIRTTRRSPRFRRSLEILEALVRSHPDQARLSQTSSAGAGTTSVIFMTSCGRISRRSPHSSKPWRSKQRAIAKSTGC